MTPNLREIEQKLGCFKPQNPSTTSSAGNTPMSVDVINKPVHRHEETKLIRYVNRMYRKWAYLIANHTKLTIIVCIALSVVCTCKILVTPYKNDAVGYVPYGARSRDEYAVREEFSSVDGRGILMMAMIVPKDGGSVLRKEIIDEALKVNEIVTTKFKMHNRITGKDETFNEFCNSFCAINEPFRQFANGFKVQMERLASNLSLNERIELAYPKTTVYGKSMNIQMNINGVTLVNDSSVDEKILQEAGDAIRITNMVSARMISFAYTAERIGKWEESEVDHFELSVVDYLQKLVYVISYSYVNAELVRAGLIMLPYLVLGFAIMSTCSAVSTLISAAYMQQISFHKIYLAIFACICPMMANATALGLLLFGGVRYGTILCVTPFLVLAIGVDDAYLMIHAWQRVVRRCQSHPVKDDCVAYRLAEVLEETGPAILISALTNILADAVGTFTSSPEITLLCYGNMASIFMDFVYQLTFYSAIMCIAGSFEIKVENEKLNTHFIEIDSEKSVDTSTCCAQTSRQFHDKVKKNCSSFLDRYVNFITNGYVAFAVFCLWVLFIVFSTIGITKIKIELTSEKLFATDSPMIESDRLRVAYQVPQYTMGQFYVNNPGNLSDPKRFNRLNQMIHELEYMIGGWGPDSSNNFIRDFIAYENFSESVDEDDSLKRRNGQLSLFNEDDLQEFLEWPEYRTWKGFLRLDKNGHLKKFLFTAANHGENLKDWPERGILLNRWRAIIDKYRDEFNTTVYHEDGVFLDLIDNMPTDAWQSGLGTLVCMAFICFIFLYDAFTVCVVSAAILSIMTGIIGLASWMGVDLEPIMMAAMLISMGFSVDIPAHVSYHYNSADAHVDHTITVKERLRICLASVGLPALQASLSTNLCVMGLLFVPLYMAQVFVRMMVSCITLCVIHGLIVIPCVFALIDKVITLCKKRKQKVSSST